MAKRALRDGPWMLEHVATLREALTRLEQPGLQLILTDLRLPDASRFESVQAFVESHPALPVIVMSTSSDERLAIDAIQEGAQYYESATIRSGRRGDPEPVDVPDGGRCRT